MQTVLTRSVGSLEEAARAAGVSTRTLLRWRDAGEFGPSEWVVLQAARGRGNAYAISLEAALRVAAAHWTPSSNRPVPEVLPIKGSSPSPSPSPSRPPSPTLVRPVPVVVRAPKVTRDLRPSNVPPLPEDWESVNAVTLRHGMRKNWRAMWQGRMVSGALPVHHPGATTPELHGGPWWHGSQVVTYALDRNGIEVFGDLYRDKPWWTPCYSPNCPACLGNNRATHP